MIEWNLSPRATRDLRDLYVYGAKTFGRTVALAYAESLYACFERIAHNPQMGRLAAAGLDVRRFEHRHHVVYYEAGQTSVRILAIVHIRSVRGIDV